jgi:hypothetical protein
LQAKKEPRGREDTGEDEGFREAPHRGGFTGIHRRIRVRVRVRVRVRDRGLP